jgi:cytochrome oxidase Cu insertion factor (SCO1/SenC/PrrC family)
LLSLRFVLVVLVCLALGGVGGLLAAEASEPERAAERFLPPRITSPDFTLRDQDGRPMSPRDARGNVLIMTFLYSTCRELCPAQAQEIKDGVVTSGVKDIQVYGISVDPVGDTPDTAHRFLRRAGLVDPRVHFLLGSRRELAAVWRQYAIAPLNATPEEAEAAAAAYDSQHGSEVEDDAEAAEYAHCPGGAAGYAQYEAAEEEEHHILGEVKPKHEEEEEEGCEQDEPPPAATDPYPDPSDLKYRGRARHGSWDFEHSAYVLVIDKHGLQRVGIPFEQLTAKRLAEDIRLLSAES